MRKLYFLFFLCFVMIGSVYSEPSKGVVKFKSNKYVPGGSKLKGFRIEMLIKDESSHGSDDDTRAPKIGQDVTVEGGELELAMPEGVADQKFNLWVKAPEVIIHGNLVELSVAKGEITEIDISGCPELYSLRVTENPLGNIDVRKNVKLGQLWASSCPNITSIDVSKNTNLNSLSVQGCNLSSLVLDNLSLLTNVFAGENPNLGHIDVSSLPLLEELWVNGNGMTSLDVSMNPKLKHLECSRNRLRGLSVANNPDLIFLSVWDNDLNGTEMDALISTLVKETGFKKREFCVFNERSSHPNVCTKAQVQAVSERGWQAKHAVWRRFLGEEYFVWEEYAGADDPTGITLPKDGSKHDVWYDLQGRRISKPSVAGLYICNGKKVIVR